MRSIVELIMMLPVLGSVESVLLGMRHYKSIVRVGPKTTCFREVKRSNNGQSMHILEFPFLNAFLPYSSIASSMRDGICKAILL